MKVEGLAEHDQDRLDAFLAWSMQLPGAPPPVKVRKRAKWVPDDPKEATQKRGRRKFKANG